MYYRNKTLINNLLVVRIVLERGRTINGNFEWDSAEDEEDLPLPTNTIKLPSLQEVESYLDGRPTHLPDIPPTTNQGGGHYGPTYNIFFTLQGSQHRLGYDYFTIDKLFVKLLDIHRKKTSATLQPRKFSKHTTTPSSISRKWCQTGSRATWSAP